MTSILPRGARLAAIALLGFAAMFALVACGDDDDGGGSGSGGNIDILTAITTLDAAGLHEMDESINENDEVPANAETIVRHMETVIRLTEWPSDLKGRADELANYFAQLAVEFDKDQIDMAKSGDLAGKMHDSWHELSHDTWAYLAHEAGVETGEGDAHN